MKKNKQSACSILFGINLTLVATVIVICTAGCFLPRVEGGEANVTATKHKTVGQVKAPDNQATDGVITYATPEGAKMEVRTGTAPQRNIAREAQTKTLTWAGIIFIAIGGIGLILRNLTFVPASSKLISWMGCLTAIGIGIALIAIPRWLNEIGPYMIYFTIGGAVLIAVLVFYLGGGFNKLKQKLDEKAVDDD